MNSLMEPRPNLLFQNILKNVKKDKVKTDELQNSNDQSKSPKEKKKNKEQV